MSLKWAVTATATSLPRASAHGDGVQVRVTSPGPTETNPLPSSVRTAHITRFVVVSHAPPATNDVGCSAASRAPARAAPAIAMRAWNMRARSAPARSSMMRTGTMTASSTRAWPREPRREPNTGSRPPRRVGRGPRPGFVIGLECSRWRSRCAANRRAHRPSDCRSSRARQEASLAGSFVPPLGIRWSPCAHHLWCARRLRRWARGRR